MHLLMLKQVTMSENLGAVFAILLLFLDTQPLKWDIFAILLEAYGLNELCTHRSYTTFVATYTIYATVNLIINTIMIDIILISQITAYKSL